jgi:group I intron endonuclease
MFIVYITTNKITDKIYIGVHEQETPYEFDGYLGSGKRLKDSIKHHGIENFTRETLFYFYNEEDAFRKESEIVTKSFVVEDWNYNMTIGGYVPPKMTPESGKKAAETRAKNGTNRKVGTKWSDERKKAWSERLKGSGNPMFGIKRFGESAPHFGKKHGEETIKKMRDIKMGNSYARKT